MKKKILVIGSIFILLSTLIVFAQYTGSDLERKKAENLYPEPGPGDLLIVDQLKAANFQLQEQSRILAEQNRILQDTLTEIKKKQTPEISGKQQQ